MVRQYLQVTDEMRKELVRLIHQESYTIARASKATQIPYDNASPRFEIFQKMTELEVSPPDGKASFSGIPESQVWFRNLYHLGIKGALTLNPLLLVH